MAQSSGAENNDSYTVVIFRGSTAKPLRFSFPRKFVRKLLIVCAIFLVADILVISHYVIRTGEVWELSAFKTEAMSAREQTVAFSTAIDDLKKRLGSMKEVNQRLRVMLGIDAPKTGDLVNGRGGEETPLPEGSAVPPGKTITTDVSMAMGSAEGMLASGQQRQPSAMGMTDLSEEELVLEVKAGLKWLSKEAALEEQSLNELSVAAEQKSSRWAATPSIWPVKGWVTSGFGPRVSPFTEKPAWHDGLDIGAAANAPVHAPAQGRVTTVGFDSKLGNVVKLDHGFGIETLYGHMAKSLVKEGQRVKRGDVVGLVGSSGLATGPHLHYMVKVNGQAYDPTKYILD
ncbi:peptidase M24 [Nitrospira sp. KM1]|uniref:M23 family metallopeptidase n=1 Tax=Nitrospira sp. KM1 TaxID=1936990 RepID=UPI0013A73251|nr:M23 family metallopeptidase [Nitrospira sp. KM1]BCA54720.1 peptidase M24 [Nitrospira sp. KM1]